MKQDYAAALNSLPSMKCQAQGIPPAMLHFGQGSTLQPPELLPHTFQACPEQPTSERGQVPRNLALSVGTHAQCQSAGGLAQQTQTGLAPQSCQQSGQCISGQLPVSAAACPPSAQPHPANGPDAHCMANTVMHDASQPLPYEEICCAQQVSAPQPTLLHPPYSMPPQRVDDGQHAISSGHHSNLEAPPRSSVASAASTSSAGRQHDMSTMEQYRSDRSSRPHWMSGGDRRASAAVPTGRAGDDSRSGHMSAAVHHPVAGISSKASAAREKENARPGIEELPALLCNVWRAWPVDVAYRSPGISGTVL